MKRCYIYLVIISFLRLYVSAQALTKTDLDYLVSEIKSNDKNRASQAAIKLATYGPAAQEAIPVLLEIVRSKELNLYVHSVLPYIYVGKPIEEILQLTQDDHSAVQSLAIECLKQYNFEKGKTIAIYTPLLDHENSFVRLGAIDALCQAGAGELCLDTVIQLMSYEDPIVKMMALSAIGDIGIANKQVKQVLHGSFSNPDKREVVKTAFIYQMLYPAEQTGLKQLQTLLKDEDRNVRWHAVRAVGNLKDVDTETLQLARALIHDDDPVVNVRACYAMIRHDIETEQAWHILKKSLENKDFNELASTLAVILDLGPAAHDCQDKLIALVNSNDDAVQLFAIAVLGKIQPSQEQVLPVIEKKLETTADFFVWNIAKKTIQNLKTSRDGKSL